MRRNWGVKPRGMEMKVMMRASNQWKRGAFAYSFRLMGIKEDVHGFWVQA